MGDINIVSSGDVAESVLKGNVDIIWGHVSRSILQKGGEFFQVPSPSDAQVPSSPSPNNLEDHMTNSHCRQFKIEKEDKRPFGRIYDDVDGKWNGILFSERSLQPFFYAINSFVPAAVLGVGLGIGLGATGFGVLTSIGYGLATIIGTPLSVAGVGSTVVMGWNYSEAYWICRKTKTSVTYERTREALEEESKEAFNEVLGKLEEALVANLVDFMEGSSNGEADDSKAEGSSLPFPSNSSLSPPTLSSEEFEEYFGKALGISFDQHTLSRLSMDPLHPIINRLPTPKEDNDHSNDKIFVLSVSLDPDHSTKTYYIISALITPPSSKAPPYLHHFRLRFSSCREIYLNISSLYPHHSLHYDSFPPRTILPCYDGDFLRERARELLGWFRVCESDEELHKSLSVELMKVVEESCDSFPSLKFLSVLKDEEEILLVREGMEKERREREEREKNKKRTWIPRKECR